MSSVQDRLVSTVSSRPSQRRDVDIELAIPWLRKKSELLQKLEKEILKDVIRNCGYQEAAKDDVIITQGETGECFYIMLTGKMSVFIDTARTDDEVSADDTTSKAEDGGKEAEMNDGEEIDDDTGNLSKKPLNRAQFGKFIMHLDAGNSFGEIALICDNCVRNATILADTDSDLLVIHRDLFNTYIKASQVAEYEEKRDFVKGCNLFKGWNSKFKILLEMSLRKEIHPYGSTIAQQGTPLEGIIFITSGQAKLMMDPSKHENQYESILFKKDRTLPVAGSKDKSNKGDYHHQVRSNKRPLTSNQVRVRRKLGYAAAEHRIMSKSVDVCCVEKGEVIGDVEMVLDMETNIGTVVSTASTTIFVLNSKNYERLVIKKHPFTVTRLAEGAYNKVSIRSRSSKGTLIPLLTSLRTELKEKLPKDPPPVKRVEILKKKEVAMQQLLDMFMKDRAPLIEPCVPNALYYKIKSAQITKTLMEHPYSQLRSLRHIDDYRKIRRKVPRSIMQLKDNLKAEKELLGGNRQVICDVNDDVFGDNKRPETSIGFARSRPPVAKSPRPKSAYAHSLKITECNEDDDHYSSGTSQHHPDNVNNLNRDTVADIFEEMELVVRENQENRMQIICSASTKQDFQAKLSRTESTANASLPLYNLYDIEYFDWETSEENLNDLENRVDEFCRSVSPRLPSFTGRRPSRPASAGSRPSKHPNLITEMKRFEINIQRPTAVPLPGGTVFVHKKPCRLPHVTHTSPGVHRHIRRFILSKEPICHKHNTQTTKVLVKGFPPISPIL